MFSNARMKLLEEQNKDLKKQLKGKEDLEEELLISVKKLGNWMKVRTFSSINRIYYFNFSPSHVASCCPLLFCRNWSTRLLGTVPEP